MSISATFNKRFLLAFQEVYNTEATKPSGVPWWTHLFASILMCVPYVTTIPLLLYCKKWFVLEYCTIIYAIFTFGVYRIFTYHGNGHILWHSLVS